MKNFLLIIPLFVFLLPINVVAQSEDPIYVVVDKMPEFNGGAAGLSTYLRTNLKYPEDAYKAKIQGVVIASFIVEKNGQVSKPTIMSGIGYGCNEEVLRLISSMPTWKPGVKAGNAVRVKLSIPIEFKL